MYYLQTTYIFDISLIAFFLWLKASITDINTTDVYKTVFPLIFNHWIQHYSIIESYQFEHLLI